MQTQGSLLVFKSHSLSSPPPPISSCLPLSPPASSCLPPPPPAKNSAHTSVIYHRDSLSLRASHKHDSSRCMRSWPCMKRLKCLFFMSSLQRWGLESLWRGPISASLTPWTRGPTVGGGATDYAEPQWEEGPRWAWDEEFGFVWTFLSLSNQCQSKIKILSELITWETLYKNSGVSLRPCPPLKPGIHCVIMGCPSWKTTSGKETQTF